MRVRHTFLCLLLGTLFALLGPSEALAAKRIGVLMTGDIPYYGTMHEAFAAELHRKYSGGEKLEFILQRPFPTPIAWSNAARKLIAFDVDLIVAYGLPAAQAVLHEKSPIPLVYAGLYESEQARISGQNVTGCGFKIPLSSVLRYLKGIKTVSTLTILYSSDEEDSVSQYQTMKDLAEQQNIKVWKVDIHAQTDLEQMQSRLTDAIFLTGSTKVHLWHDDILAIAKKAQAPTADIFPGEAEDGVLMALFQPAPTQGRMAAEMAGRILQGEKTAAIPPHIVRDTELEFNLVAAKQLSITIPIQLLIEATKVVE